MDDRSRQLAAVIGGVRLCFNLLKSRADEMHADLGVTASMRAVMESLQDGAERTVPDIARAKGVSRQHIQTIMNALAKAGLVVARDNPADKRTFLMSLSGRGAEVFEKIRARERVELGRLAEAFSGEELQHAGRTLGKLSNTVKGRRDDAS